MSDPAVFVDRDGVHRRARLGRRARVVRRPARAQDDVRLVPGAADAIRRIRSLDCRAGGGLQPASRGQGQGLARRAACGPRARGSTARRRGRRRRRFRYCLHHPDAIDPHLAGGLRLPQAGAGHAARRCAASSTSISSRSWMIGDTDIDVEAGRAAGCRTVLVENPRVDARATRRRRRPTSACATSPGASTIVTSEARLSMLESISTKIFADGADLDGILGSPPTRASRASRRTRR